MIVGSFRLGMITFVKLINVTCSCLVLFHAEFVGSNVSTRIHTEVWHIDDKDLCKFRDFVDARLSKDLVARCVYRYGYYR